VTTPTLEVGVMGLRERDGLLLRADSNETLAWDIANDITSTACTRMEELGGWWIEASYFDTTVDIVLRSFGSVLVLDRVAGDRLLSRDGGVAVQERLL